MSLQDWLAAFRRANASDNVGVFRARLIRVLRELPEGWTQDWAILNEWKIAQRRIKREGLTLKDNEPRCRCGHTLSWHIGGLSCETCRTCPVFQPVDLPDPPKATTYVPATRTRRTAAATNRPKYRDVPAMNPWEERLKANREKVPPSSLKDMPPGTAPRVPAGKSQHLTARATCEREA